MNLEGVGAVDQLEFRKLLIRTGNSRLVDASMMDQIIGKLSDKEFLEGCRHYERRVLEPSAKGRSEQTLWSCLNEGIKYANDTAVAYFLDRHTQLFNKSFDEMGNLPIHNYVK
mgnify:CR=1 FL=1